MKGKVRWFSPEKGFGFIYSKEHGGDIFVHTSGIKAEDGGLKVLHAEDQVEFESVKEVKGFAAKNVIVIKKGKVKYGNTPQNK